MFQTGRPMLHLHTKAQPSLNQDAKCYKEMFQYIVLYLYFHEMSRARLQVRFNFYLLIVSRIAREIESHMETRNIYKYVTLVEHFSINIIVIE